LHNEKFCIGVESFFKGNEIVIDKVLQFEVSKICPGNYAPLHSLRPKQDLETAPSLKLKSFENT